MSSSNPPKLRGESNIGAVIDTNLEPVLAPGVCGILLNQPDGIWIPYIRAIEPGRGDVARFLDDLPRDRRILFPNVLSPLLRAMLARRGFIKQLVDCPPPDPEAELGQVECYVREPKLYTCERCAEVTPAVHWGPGWITCPKCQYVARTVFEKKHNLRDPSKPANPPSAVNDTLEKVRVTGIEYQAQLAMLTNQLCHQLQQRDLAYIEDALAKDPT